MHLKTILLAIICLPMPAWAQCVKVHTSTAPYSVSQSKSVAQIHGMSDIPDWVPADAGMAMGNFESQLDVKYDTGNDFIAYSPCGPFSYFNVHVSFTDAVINIGREIAAHSCMYNAAVAHELKHYNDYKEALGESGHGLQTKIATYLQQLPPSTPESADTDRYNAQVAINALIEQYSKDLYAELERRNKLIDTQAESMRVYGECPEQIKDLQRASGN